MRDSMRRLLIDRLLTEQKIVKFEQLQEMLGVSSPTVKRDLRFMREVLGAPIVYNRLERGYCYDPLLMEEASGKGRGQVYRKSWYSPQELYILVKTIRLLGELSKNKTSALYQDLEPLRSRVLAVMSLGGKLPSDLLDRVKIVDDIAGALSNEPDSFATVGASLTSGRRLKIQYDKRTASSHPSIREISPLRMVHYRNRWYVDAFCHTAGELRTFAIEYITRAELLTTPARAMTHKDAERLDASYGIFRGSKLKTAVLHFDEEAAPHIRRQVWHAKQRIVQDEQGLRMTLPYANSTELVGEILRWGQHVTVLEPEELRETVRNALQETLKQYQSKEQH